MKKIVLRSRHSVNSYLAKFELQVLYVEQAKLNQKNFKNLYFLSRVEGFSCKFLFIIHFYSFKTHTNTFAGLITSLIKNYLLCDLWPFEPASSNAPPSSPSPSAPISSRAELSLPLPLSPSCPRCTTLPPAWRSSR